jgi:hypothetical protein
MIVKLAVVTLLALVAVVLGAQASAWRRASVHIAQSAKIYRSLRHGAIPEDGLAVSEQMIQEFEPPFVSWRKRAAIVLTILAAALAFVVFTWYWGLATFVGCLVAAELLRSATLPRPDSDYFLAQLIDDFEQRAKIAESFGNESALPLEESANVLRQMLEQRTRREARPSE